MSGVSASASTESPGPPLVVTLNQNQESKTQVCKYFVKHQTCQFGNKCRFLHPQESYPVYVQRSFPVEDAAVSVASPTRTTKPKVYVPPHRLRPRAHHEAVSRPIQDEDTLPIDQNTFGQVCKFYSRNGFCKFGDNCKYIHEEDEGGEDTTEADVREQSSYGARRGGRGGRGREFNRARKGQKTYTHTDPESRESAEGRANQRAKPTKSKKQRPKQLCRYFKNGDCRQDDTCKFWHPSELSEIPNDDTGVVGELADDLVLLDCQTDHQDTKLKDEVSASKRQKEIVQPSAEFSIEALTDEEAAKHRIAEINTLMKRFPRVQETVLPKRDEEAYKIAFVPSDPDWPYDVKKVQMTILFPESYPRESMMVKLSKDQALPDTVRRYLYNSITDWLDRRYERLIQRMRVELVFRPFLRWLDKNAQDLFTGGLKQYQRELMAKAAGIEIVTAGELKEKYERDSDGEYSEEEENSEETAEYSDEEEDQSEEDDEEYETASDEDKKNTSTSVDPVRKGTEVKLHNLQLKDGAVTLMGLKLHLVIQCGRCKNKDEINVRQNQGVSLICGKCSNTSMVAFRPAIVHQFSAVLGYLDMKECHAFDLVLSESEFMIGCEKCNKEMKVQGISPGQPRDMWCQHCYQKLKVVVETTRFLNLQPNELSVAGMETLVGKKAIKHIKDPSIKEGFPLPDNGTCRHYKKSFRWLRFPCCGKAYPCDVCHDEKEGHEMVFANRMICGFCSREQFYTADRPCKGCDSSMTKKVTTHWEGGNGCRDKIKMSRGDDRKYSNINKTISRRATQQKSTGKKTTKLRHS